MATKEITEVISILIPEDGGTPHINGPDGRIFVFDAKGKWWVREANDYAKASSKQRRWCRQLAQTYFEINHASLLPNQIKLLERLLA